MYIIICLCITLQHTATYAHTGIIFGSLAVMSTELSNHTLQHAATHWNILEHTATHCNILQHTATHCNTHTHTQISYSILPIGSSIGEAFDSRTATHFNNTL